MYDIRQFKPAMYVLLMLGISGFALAAESPVLWLAALGAITINAYLVWRCKFRPIPRSLANLVTLASVAYIMRELLISGLTPVMVVGQFLVILQIVKLWEQRANRDWAQLLVLSLLLMVAASMNTASLWFGAMLAIYLFVSLYCCLLFHLKVETDAARAAMGVPQGQLSPPGTLEQDQRRLGQSMRRLTALVSSVGIAFAVVVFLAFPRGREGGMLGQLRQGGTALTGFNDEVRFQDVARIQQSHEKVAFVKLWHNGQLIAGTAGFYLRGLTLDVYEAPGHFNGTWEWKRSLGVFPARRVRAGDRASFVSPATAALPTPPEGADQWRQQITLWPTHTAVLFAMPGVTQFTPSSRDVDIRYSGGDGAIQTESPLNEQLDYEVVSTNRPGGFEMFARHGRSAAALREAFPRIYEFARRPEVCGSDALGSLGEQRTRRGLAPGELDAQIAANIERYLRTQFAYTLDLTDESSIRGQNPLEAFLYKWKRGHCEYFAGAMTLMCQTLGMQARMAIGFRCGPENYNDFSNSYTVYDSDAHAWVEVKTPRGWETFDPTSSRETVAKASAGLMGKVRHLLEYVEVAYANSVIAYDAQSRESVLSSVETALTQAVNGAPYAMSRLGSWIANSRSFWDVWSVALTAAMVLMLAVVVVAFAWFVWERWRLFRRAHRIGIESLPEADQLRLARQLGFYDELIRLLDRHRITRPAHFTPREFGRSLSFLPAEAYTTIQRLTSLFYRVRYGGMELPASRQRRLETVLARLSHDLAASMPAASR